MAVLQSATVMVYDHSELGVHTSKKCYSLGRMLSDLSSRDLPQQKRDRIEGNAGTELSLEGRVKVCRRGSDSSSGSHGSVKCHARMRRSKRYQLALQTGSALEDLKISKEVPRRGEDCSERPSINPRTMPRGIGVGIVAFWPPYRVV